MALKKGNRTYFFEKNISFSCWATSAGKKEGEGPLGKNFDIVFNDSFLGQKSWEKGESKMIEASFLELLKKSGLKDRDIDIIFAGDLMNQCTSSTYALRNFDIPVFGIYGACSNMGEALILSALFLEAGGIKRACAMTSSHFCTAERQFRHPLEYGGVKSLTSQWTVTACGASLLEVKGFPPFIRAFTSGSITDLGVKDITNMGAAMAPDDEREKP